MKQKVILFVYKHNASFILLIRLELGVFFGKFLMKNHWFGTLVWLISVFCINKNEKFPIFLNLEKLFWVTLMLNLCFAASFATTTLNINFFFKKKKKERNV